MKRLSPSFAFAALVTLWIGAAALAQKPMSSEEFWRDIVKKPLTAPDGREAFARNYKDALLPGPPMRGAGIRGTVISATPVNAPAKLVLAITDRTTPEATLVFVNGQSLPRPVPVGTRVEFQGVAKNFTADPFMVIFDVDRDDVFVDQ